MAAAPLHVETLTDADFNARAPIPIDELPTARDIRLKHNTWMLVGGLVSFLGVTISGTFIPFGFMLSIIMGMLVRETAKSAHENFPLPLYLLLSAVGATVSLVAHLKGWV